MKSKLYLKVFSGPLLGAIKSGTQHITGDIPEAIIHILAILKKSRFNADYSKLRLKVRRFGPDGMIADGYFAYAPRTFRAAEWDSWLASVLDPVLLYRAFASNCSEVLFSGPSLPHLPALPQSVAVVWSASTGVSQVTGGL